MYRQCRPRLEPAPGSAIAWSGRPGPPGGRLGQEIAPKRYAMLNCGSASSVIVSSGSSSSYFPLAELRLEARAAEVLEGADPVDVGEQGVVGEGHALHGPAGREVEHGLGDLVAGNHRSRASSWPTARRQQRHERAAEEPAGRLAPMADR